MTGPGRDALTGHMAQVMEASANVRVALRALDAAVEAETAALLALVHSTTKAEQDAARDAVCAAVDARAAALASLGGWSPPAFVGAAGALLAALPHPATRARAATDEQPIR